MLELTFGEQVKLVLGRKNMTIKQLAEQIELKTGVKMSRQNLTQRLGRDNFQEQDMRMIAEILECPFQLSILEVKEKPQVMEVERVEVADYVETKTEAKTEAKTEPFEAIKETIKEPVKPREQEVVKEPAIEVVEPKIEKNRREVTIEEVQPVSHKETLYSKQGEINPYTGFEYKSNTVRSHPKRIGYVQVYDRKDHQWTEMTEWAFLGFQERQKLSLGKNYQEPTYLD